ncbi:cation:proton antiporter [Pontibacter sp. JH31]|uniref:Cation:proton antiporter n=1 Tax=Pontibacter aquaedesilientis TaxID=2766980 RepID=A0ABR7XD82_9BACT|nr:cation:proton antiporter [Pontibacter aquaedesilientis]MBD1396240.1 cation:proton antiporter [Pontibacter aquaedesilientis]
MDHVLNNPFFELSIILAIAAILGGIGLLLRQPLIVMFIALGILVGPSALNLVSSSQMVHLLADLGIALLLFVVGLKLDLKLIRSTGAIALMTGLGQVVFTSVLGYILGIALGYDHVTSLYIAIALTFSSTIIIVKLLSDKNEIDSLHGQIAIGFLIVQDIVVVLLMIVLSALDAKAGSFPMVSILQVLLTGSAIVAVIGLLMRFILPRLVNFLAHSQELLVLFSISWAVAVASACDYLDFSREVGAFLAGVSLASTPYREIISGRLVSLRDFLLLFFFINLGSQLNLSLLGEQIGPSLIFSVFVLVGNPLIVVAIMGVMGYRKRTSFLAGLTVAQISEFSLIFAAMGLSMGHIQESSVGLITLVGLITIGLSTYMILYSHQLYDLVAPFLHVFERRVPFREEHGDEAIPAQVDVVLFGLGRYGGNIALTLQRENIKMIGVDFDPQQVRFWQQQGIAALYGDVEDPEMPARLPLNTTRFVISSLGDVRANIALIRYLKASGYQGIIAVTAHRSVDAARLKETDADLILSPFADAAETIPAKLNIQKSTDQ